MARTTIAVQQILRSGLEAVYTAANADGHALLNDGKRTFLHVVNGDAADKTLTFATPLTVDGLAVADRTVVVTAAEERLIGPFPTEIYGQSDGTIHVDYSDVTSVTVAALRL
jgi:hypothetical protein